MAFTDNGAPSLASTLDPRLNLFFKTVRDLGSFDKITDEKSTENDGLYNLIDASWAVNKLDTMKILMNWRDCRGGKGDHSGFLVAIAYLWGIDPDWVDANMHIIPEYGSWLDLIKLWHVCPINQSSILAYIANKLQTDKQLLDNKMSGISLVAKWIPSENSKWDRYSKDRFCISLCRRLFNATSPTGNDLKHLRKDFLAPLREHLSIVETKMCQKQYNQIEYEKVPSVAMNKYKNAFYRNDNDRFSRYIESVCAGKTKINSSQVYPHDLVRQYLSGEQSEVNNVIEAQWKDIKTKVQASGAFDKSLCVVDVSGSMEGTPMEVAIALGLLSLNANNKNQVITFSAHPKLHTITDSSLYKQVKNIERMEWGYNTNFMAVMDVVIQMLEEGSDIERLYVFSDMQFDAAFPNSTSAHYEILKQRFAEKKLTMPTIVFWNLQGNTTDFPVTCNDKGVIMLSGYSPSLLSSILDDDEITPLSMMFKVIHGPRYDMVVAPTQ